MRRDPALALFGGTSSLRAPLPVMHPGEQQLGPAEEAAVLAVLRSRSLHRYDAPRSTVRQLEEAFSRRTGVPHALAVSSGTSALLSALVGLGVGPGDEVIVPAYTWVSTINAVILAGAVPILAEIDDSLGIDPADAAAKISPFTRALLPVHMRGAPCRIAELAALAKERGLALLEDCAQAPGATFGERPVGSFGDAAAFSFQSFKVVTSGEGGMVLARDRDVFLRAAAYHDYDCPPSFGVPVGEWLRTAIPGQSFRMSEVAGALALAQLGRLDATVEAMRQRKQRLVGAVEGSLRERGGRWRSVEAGELGLALVFFLPEAGQAREAAAALVAEGVTGAQVLYDPAVPDGHVYPSWSALLARRGPSPRFDPWSWGRRAVEYRPDMCPRTLDLLGRAVHLDVSPALDEEQLAGVAAALHKVLAAL